MSSLKPIAEQAIVVLGASSGIGRETALQLGKQGAKLIVAARSTKGIETLVNEIKSFKRSEVEGVICDVADFDQVKALAKKCFDKFGRIDTWVQPAGVTLFAKFEDTTEEEMRRVMDVNFLGQCRGAWAALPYLKKNSNGGALIHVGSVESKRSIPNQSAYSSSKHAMDAFTEALRVELAQEKSNVSVTLVMPSNIDTPFYEKCRTKVDGGKYVYTGPSPTYKASHVAGAIIHAATNRVRRVTVGDGGAFLSLVQGVAPSTIDIAFTLGGDALMRTGELKRKDDNLYQAIDEVEINRVKGVGMYPMPFSLYNWWFERPIAQYVTYALFVLLLSWVYMKLSN
ncbi:3-dehydrosphinganine reductase [Acrasis kona]|uniref:3-dehydrosphinganine reductase n=1 Tax=Acrasis kona TaxID=1008807 RepID=A0AAW2ZD11_9EUKA